MAWRRGLPSIAGTAHARALAALRVIASSLLFIHGSTRFLTHGVAGFEEFFVGHHLPAVGAWIITFMEILGTPVLAAGYLVRPLALYFAVELMMGIIMVHAQHGWFVVGGGSNGVEYSVLLVSVFLALAYVGSHDNRSSSTGR